MSNLTRRDFHRVAGGSLLGLTLSSSPLDLIAAGKKKIKVGQIGTTHSHAEGKIKTLKKLDDIFDVVGIVEPDDSIREQISLLPAYSGIEWMTETELLSVPGLEAVLVETDLADLVPVAQRCIDAGKHVHIDKPPGTSLTDLKKCLKTASEKRLVVQMGYMFRHHPAFQFCLRAVQLGWLGEIFEVEGVKSKVVKPERRPRLAETYGGSMMLLGCHLIDILIALCGKPDRVIPYRRQTRPEKDKLHDNELAVFEFSKATATIRSTLTEVEGKQRRQFVVCGTRGTIEIKPLEPAELRMALDHVEGEYVAGYQMIPLPPVDGRYDEQLRDFVRTIRREKEPAYSMEHELTVQRALLQASGILKQKDENPHNLKRGSQ